MPEQGEIRPSEPAEPPRSLLQRLRSALGFGEEATLREEIAAALAEEGGSLEEGFSAEERALLLNILGLREVRVVDVAIPRADIVAVDVNVTLGEALRVFRDAAHSRLPVYRQTLDDPVGMVHIRDVVSHLAAALPPAGANGGSGLDLAAIDPSVKLSQLGILRSVLFVPPSMPVLDLLVQMQANHIHMALVIDEFGGTDGLVSIEDLVEQVVGDIEDEHDENEDAVLLTEDGFVASARASLDDVRAGLGEALPIIVPPDVANAVDTLGGLVITLAGRVPLRGDIVRGPGDVEFEVLDADPRRVKRVRIRKVPQPEPPAEDEGSGNEAVAVGARRRS